MRVAAVWRGISIFLLGIIVGGVLTITNLVPPSTQINLGRVKIKGGKGETTVRDLLGIQVENQANRTRIREESPPSPLPSRAEELSKKEIRQERRDDRKEIRQERRENRKEGR